MCLLSPLGVVVVVVVAWVCYVSVYMLVCVYNYRFTYAVPVQSTFSR